jgi:thiol-disulfide isomerase/thioredoxin
MTRRWIIVFACVAALVIVTAAVRNRRVSASPDVHPTTESKTGAVIRLVKNPSPVPDFSARDLDGNTIKTADWPGKVTILTFWATWCPPCREEIPELIALQKQYASQLRIVGISMDDGSPEEVRRFAKKVGINYPIVMATDEIVAKFGSVPGLPTSFVIDREAKIVQKHVGLYPPSVYDSEVRALLGLPVDATIETFEDNGQVILANAAHATELPGVDLSKLTPQQKKAALKRMNAESCTCGCGLTIAQCRINDTACKVSEGLARQIVEEIARGAAPATKRSAK